ncbi:MAG: chalcone isomerase family protein [Gammaproteobacteria bacterium]|jgi:hypothetical protein
MRRPCFHSLVLVPILMLTGFPAVAGIPMPGSRDRQPVVTVAHVALPRTVTLAGSSLILNGSGVRRKYFVEKTFVAALYLPLKAKYLDMLIAEKGPSRLSLHMLADRSARDFDSQLNDAFRANTPAGQVAAMQQKLKTLEGYFPDLRKGDTVNIDYVPTKGLSVTVNGTREGRVRGAAFYAAWLRAWLGRSPLDGDLKAALLDQH